MAVNVKASSRQSGVSITRRAIVAVLQMRSYCTDQHITSLPVALTVPFTAPLTVAFNALFSHFTTVGQFNGEVGTLVSRRVAGKPRQRISQSPHAVASNLDVHLVGGLNGGAA